MGDGLLGVPRPSPTGVGSHKKQPIAHGVGSYKRGLGSLWERTLCAMVFRACSKPIAHRVGS